MNAVRELLDAPPPYATVVFDCDSTLSALEGIEELARDNAEVARLTQLAMEGAIALEEVYGARLALVKPSRADVEHIGQRYVETLLPNVAQLVAALQALGKRVCIVSGGVRPAVAHLARALAIPDACVHAVELHFDAAGRYAGFDQRSPLARAGGKVEVLRGLRRAGEALVFVGDGATDLEAAGEATRFVAFGGVERRKRVLEAARVRCLDPDFRALVPLLLSGAEIANLASSSAHRPLVELPRSPTPPTA
ncbi:MAG: HAD family hydrolase [Planctomycetes bacterium]|nr:HAD family hydrolase [Planctomycetota bacterium]